MLYRQADGSLAKLAIKEFIIPANDEELLKDAEDVWTSEVNTLNEISGLSHPNLIQRIAAITRGEKRYLMFLWADGGNLEDFWIKFPNPTVTAGLVKDIIEQLRGMAEALEKLHGYRGQYHYRHGDIKPQNILNFPDSNPERIGIFKISDLGSAKHHSVATRLRERTGDKAFATTQYQPPESITNKLSARSRLYDIWSMGCVILEFMVWLLYGYEQLQEFKARIKGTLEEPCSFFVIEQKDTTASLVAHIHPAVQACLDSMSEDPECMGDSALADLLDIVKTKLLVVKLPQHSESFIGTTDSVSITNTDARSYANQPFGRHRSSAEGFRQALDDILKGKKASNEYYWFTGHRRDNIRLHRVVPKIDVEGNSSRLFPGWKPQSNPMVNRTKTPNTTDMPDSTAITDIRIQNVRTQALNIHSISVTDHNVNENNCRPWHTPII